MTDAIRHRGPDSSGHHSRGGVHLGARRLSIIDLDSGDQPIYNETGDKAIVFNGEIYNYRELQQDLRRKGHTLATQTDTEVILHLYEEYGRDCVHHLRGMFAFAIDDGDSVFIARDRLGIKPLYYCHVADRGLFFFASEIKALLRCPEVSAEIDRQAVVDRLLLTHLAEIGTFFRHIESLEPGCTLEVRQDGDALQVDKRRYYAPSLEPDDSISLAEAQERLHELLAETVEGHLVADVEVALLLSGGLDSGLIAALMRRSQDSLRAFTTSVQEDHADLVNARAIARGLGIDHEVLNPTYDEYLGGIPDWIACQEMVTTLMGMSSMLLCRRVGEQCKVCLNGEGSDEIFGGYSEFSGELGNLDYLRRMLQRLADTDIGPSPGVVAMVRELVARRKEGRHAYLRALFEYHQGPPLVQNHLEHVDKMGMASSVEIRVPFMDHVLVDFVNRLPLELKVNTKLAVRKYVLRRIAVDHYSPLLTDAALRSKLGMPQACGSHRQRFFDDCNEILPADYLERHDIGLAFPSRGSLALFELFQAIFVDHRGEVPEDLDVLDFVRSRAAAAPPVRHSVAVSATAPDGAPA